MNDSVLDFQAELKNFLNWFMVKEEHKWIKSEYGLLDTIIDVFERLTVKELTKLMETKNIRIVPFYSESFKTHRGHVLAINIEWNSEERNLKTMGAYVCREIGKILYSNPNQTKSKVEEEIAADRFAVSKGYAEEIENLLLDSEEGMEKRLRLVYLTSLVMREEQY